MENKYVVPNIPGFDPRGARVLQDFADRLNYLLGEVNRLSQRPEANSILARGGSPGMVQLPGSGAPGYIRVGTGGLIESYAGSPNISSNGQIIGVPYAIASESTQVPTSGAALTELHRVTIPAGSLANNDDVIEIHQHGLYANNANLKLLNFIIGPTTVEATGALDIRSLNWHAYTMMNRLSSTTVAVNFTGWYNFVQSDATPAFIGGFGGRWVSRGSASFLINNADTLSNDLVVQGQGTANGDVIQLYTLVRLTRMS